MSDICTGLLHELEALQPGESLVCGDVIAHRLAPSRIAGLFRLDFLAVCDEEDYVASTLWLPDADAAARELEVNVSFTVPRHVERRQRALNVAARSCYALRDAASGIAALDLQEVGDVYLHWTLALMAEFTND